MNNTNVPTNGAGVKSSPAAAIAQVAAGNTPNANAQTATAGTPPPPTPSKPPKEKVDTLSKQWADRLLKNKTNPWFAEAGHTSGGVAIHKWNGSYLQFVGFEEGSALVADWLDKAAPDKASDAACNSAWAYGCKRLRTQRPIPQQDRSRNIIPCADVYLEMTKQGIKAIKPDPSYGMTYAVKLNAGTQVGQRHTIKPLSATSRFRKFMETALPDADVRALVQEQCGLTLLPANYQIASWWVGAAGSGKSTLVELCKAMQRQVACISLDDLGKQFGLEGLVGASVVQVDEVEAERWAEGRFKSLVGGNGCSIDRKNEKALMDYHLWAKWLITSNAKPFVRDKSDGVWRRLCIVPFDVVIPEEQRVKDFHLLLLKEEGAQILDWMLEGAQRLVCRDRFLAEHERPQAVRELKEESRNDCDSVRAWVKIFDVRLGGAGDDLHTKDTIYNNYETWCKAAHQEPLLPRVFWKGLRGQISGILNINKRVGGKQVYFCNLAWTDPQMQSVALPVKVMVPVKPSAACAPAIAIDHQMSGTEDLLADPFYTLLCESVIDQVPMQGRA